MDDSSGPSGSPFPAVHRRRNWWLFVGLALLGLGGGTAYWLARPPAAVYVGDAACHACHAEISDAYAATAHALTSRPASAEAIHGDFGRGGNEMPTANPELFFRMTAEGGRFAQAALRRRNAAEVVEREELIDLIIGSGRKGQTYLYWTGDTGDELCQLPVSYWTEHRKWVNSPGFVDGRANFDRPIPARCLECHASHVTPRPPPVNRYDRASLILGISCEKCHGPGGEHVARYRSANPPSSLAAAAILNPSQLPRERQIDLCAWCHAGEGRPVSAPLTYRPGDVLAEHLTFPRQVPGAPLDVHASQVQLLERSRCFQASDTMTCNTCHDVHRPQRDLVQMAANCTQCHQVEDCGQFRHRGATIASGCVDCHMPLEQTAQIVIADQGGGTLRPKVRNHHIAVYPVDGEQGAAKGGQGAGGAGSD